MRRGRKPQTDIAVQSVIEALALQGWGAALIHRHLEFLAKQDGSPLKAFEKRLPAARTVQRIVASLQPRDTSGPWTLRDSDPDDTRLILGVLAAVVVGTGGRITHLSKAEADWVLRIRKAVPDTGASAAWALARFYMARDARGEATADIDYYLAFAPWRGEEAATRYAQAVKEGWIPRNPSWLTAEDIIL